MGKPVGAFFFLFLVFVKEKAIVFFLFLNIFITFANKISILILNRLWKRLR